MHELLALLIQYGDTLSITRVPPQGAHPRNEGEWRVRINDFEVYRLIEWGGKEGDALRDALIGLVKYVVRSAKIA